MTKQKLENKSTFFLLEEVPELDKYDYLVIASETNKHYEQLKYLESKVFNKIIFCEKPLFETAKALKMKNNQVFLGYVLRFHPLLQKLKEFLIYEKVLSVNVSCGQYLPTWRPNSDYRNSYSAKKSEGGGVLLDLSHEIDYVQWLFGKILEIKSYQVKISDLEIDSDDLTTFIAKTEKGSIVNISVDYISKITHRRVFVNTLENSYELDLISNKLIKKSKNSFTEIYNFTDFERNFMFEQMHKSVIGNLENICTYNEGLDVMNTIHTIQGQNI